MFATLDGSLLAELAFGALHTQNDLLGGLGLEEEYKKNTKLIFIISRHLDIQCGGSYLLSENRLGLTSETLLLTIVTTTSLGGAALLGLLVLCDLVQLVAFALFAESAALFRHVHL